MSVNTSHANNGVLLYNGEYILIYAENVEIDFEKHVDQEFEGAKTGKIYLTSHRQVKDNYYYYK